MHIARLELFKVPPRWLFLKIATDDGLAGWGEPVVEGRADTVAAAVSELAFWGVSTIFENHTLRQSPTCLA